MGSLEFVFKINNSTFVLIELHTKTAVDNK